MVIAFLVACLSVIADQVSKGAIVSYFQPIDGIAQKDPIVLIDGVLRFSYLENDGISFGWLSGYRWLFMTLTVLLIIAMVIFLYYYRKSANLWLRISCGLIIGGGIGNMIDRVGSGYVVDFIDFHAFDFWKWIFNVADSCVCVGAFMMIIYLIMDSIRCKRQKKTEEAEFLEEDE